MLEVLAIMRFVAGALVASYGLAKLLAFPASIDSIWRPERVKRPVALATGAVVSGIEIALGTAVGLGVWVGAGAGLATLALGMGLTVYGHFSLRYSGRCGCAGSRPEATTPARLLMRNFAIFAAILMGAVAAPSLDALVHRTDSLLTLFAALPAAVLLVSWGSSALWSIRAADRPAIGRVEMGDA